MEEKKNKVKQSEKYLKDLKNVEEKINIAKQELNNLETKKNDLKNKVVGAVMKENQINVYELVNRLTITKSDNYE